LHIDGDDTEFTTYSNHWAPVQLYYATYLSLRAYFEACGSQIPNEHSKNLKTINNEILSKPGLFPFPFQTMCSCSGTCVNSSHFLYLPDGKTVNKISGLKNFEKVNSYDFFALCLKTTRDKQIEKLCEDWKHRYKKKRVSPVEKVKMVNNLVPTSIFNFLYRLRLRSNYEDADSFLLSLPTETEAQEFNKSLRVIGWYVQLLFETLIMGHIGIRLFTEMVTKFTKYEKYGVSKITVNKRLKLITAAVF
jgi:hypothetical protein